MFRLVCNKKLIRKTSLVRLHTRMSSDSESSQTDTLLSLYDQIQVLKKQSDLLLHRVDSMQQCLKQESFDLAKQIIQIAPTQKAKGVQSLLVLLQLEETDLTVGSFLTALNSYLIQNNLVDLNDLQIHMNPMLQSAFQKASGIKKIPYGLLLNSLPQMFV